MVVHLYRPFSAEHLLRSYRNRQAMAVLDSTKEPGARRRASVPGRGHLVVGNLDDKSRNIIGGRYGLSSKDFTPAMVKAVYDELKEAKPKNHFTIGIDDDVTHTSLTWDPSFSPSSDNVVRAIFFGLGSDGTVGANKNTIKIIGQETDFFSQGFFVYDSKKAGSKTISHLRFGTDPIRATYLIQSATFIACHRFDFVHSIHCSRKCGTKQHFPLGQPLRPRGNLEPSPTLAQEIIIEK